MKQHNLNNSAYQKKQRKYNSYDRKSYKYTKNRLNRRFNTDRPYQKLTTDISEFRYGNQNINHRVYLSPILDLFSGEIFAYEINEHPTTKTVITSLKKAIKKYPV